MYKVVQLSLQPHSRRLATLGLQTINFCLCLTVIGWRYYFHTRHHHHHHQYVNIIIKGGNSAYVLFIGTSAAQLGNELGGIEWDFRYYLLILWQALILFWILYLTE